MEVPDWAPEWLTYLHKFAENHDWKLVGRKTINSIQIYGYTRQGIHIGISLVDSNERYIAITCHPNVYLYTSGLYSGPQNKQYTQHEWVKEITETML